MKINKTRLNFVVKTNHRLLSKNKIYRFISESIPMIREIKEPSNKTLPKAQKVILFSIFNIISSLKIYQK